MIIRTFWYAGCCFVVNVSLMELCHHLTGFLEIDILLFAYV